MDRRFDELPETLKRSILDNFAMNRVVPITAEQVSTILTTFQASLFQSLREQARVTDHAISSLSSRGTTEEGTTRRHENAAGWQWGNRFHPVPRGFTFPW